MKRRMRRARRATRLASGLLLILGLLPQPSAAQPTAAPGFTPGSAAGVPDVPSGPAAIRGRILHASRPDAGAGLGVLLYALPTDGSPGLRTGVADAEGAFAFEGVSNEPSTAYLVGLSYAGVPFGQRLAFAPGQTEQTLEIEIREPSTDASDLRVGAVQLRIEAGCEDLRVVESHELFNPTERPIFVPPDQREGRAALLEIELPDVARDPQAPPSAQGGLVIEGRRARFWGPLFPGPQTVELGYVLPGAPGTLELRRPLASGAAPLRVLVPPDSLEIRGGPLQPGGPLLDGDRPWRTARADRIAPGEELAFALEIPERKSPSLPLARVELRVELDEAAMRVDETWHLETEGERIPAAGAPLLCLPLPAEAQEVRFSALLEPDPSGGLALRGPVTAGAPRVGTSYLLPVEREPVLLARRFPQALPLLSIFLADTGVVAESDRLHRRRPVLGEARTYLHLEAFEIAEGETIELALRRLPAQRPTPVAATTLLAVVAAAASLGFLAGPLRRTRDASEPREAVESEVRRERDAVYAALRDLEHDFETGKLEADDYDSFRSDLRARAVELMRQERREEREASAAPAAPAPAPGEASGRACASCGAALGADARFCSQCGARVAGGGPA